MKWKIMILLFLALLFFSAGYYTQYITSEKKPEIAEIEKPVYKIIKVPQTESEKNECLNSKIEITQKMKTDSVMTIIARDDCKATEKDILIDKKTNWDYILYSGAGGFIAGIVLVLLL